MRHVQSALGVSERRACRTLGQPRWAQRKVRAVSADEAALTDAAVSLAAEYGRYGYRQIRSTRLAFTRQRFTCGVGR